MLSPCPAPCPCLGPRVGEGGEPSSSLPPPPGTHPCTHINTLKLINSLSFPLSVSLCLSFLPILCPPPVSVSHSFCQGPSLFFLLLSSPFILILSFICVSFDLCFCSPLLFLPSFPPSDVYSLSLHNPSRPPPPKATRPHTLDLLHSIFILPFKGLARFRYTNTIELQLPAVFSTIITCCAGL